jgi:hypothetical protein
MIWHIFEITVGIIFILLIAIRIFFFIFNFIIDWVIASSQGMTVREMRRKHKND